MRVLPALFLALFVMVSAPAFALLDGVQATNFSDMNLPSWGIGDPAVSASIDICVYSVSLLSSSKYAVKASSPGGFFLNNGANQIPYTLFWEDSGAGNLGSNAGVQLTNNVKLANRNNANVLSVLCSLGLAGPTARLTLKITQAAMTAAIAGTYTGVLTVVISAD